MINYIKGKIIELSPTLVVIENNGIGYDIEISLQTYEQLEGKEEATVFIYHHIRQREDIELYYGFSSKDERELFKLIIGVSGIGVNSARMILSSMSSDELRNAILSENVNAIKAVKGIGLKSAQRMILELKDKVVKGEGSDSTQLFKGNNTEIANEATTALIMLGFPKANVNKVLQQILHEKPDAKVEDLIKSALQRL